MRYLGALAFVAALAAWLWLFFHECERPVCRVIGVYTYRVSTLPEYINYVAGSDLFHIHDAASLAFSCDTLRDQFTKGLHEAMVAKAPLGSNTNALRDEVTRLGLLSAKHEGNILHLTDDATIGKEGLKSWAQRVRRAVESEPQSVREQWPTVVMKRLFEAVVLHAGDTEVRIDLHDKYKCP